MEDQIKVYGVTWCPDCHRAKRFFQRYGITFDFINIDHDKNGEDFVIQTNQGFRSVPTIVFPDGSILVEPSNQQLMRKMQLN